MPAAPLDVPAWQRALRGVRAAELHQARLEREELARRREEHTRLEAARRAEDQARQAERAAQDMATQQRLMVAQRAQTGMSGGDAIVAAWAHCKRQQDRADEAAATALAAEHATHAQAEVAAQAQQRWLQQRARLEAVQQAVQTQRRGLHGAQEGLAELVLEEDATLAWSTRPESVR
jgi:hypothetical protein